MLRLQARLARQTPRVAKLAPGLCRGIQTYDTLDSQVNILRNGKTVISQGPGGRSSRTGYTVTVFGAPGYVGTALAAKLGKNGTTIVAPYREEYFQRHLKVTGDLGVVNYQEFDLRNIESIENSVRHSDVVVNLIGRDWETKNFSFYDVHVEGARRIAQAVEKFGVPRYIHMSSHSADVASSSKFYATKAAGEEAVREILPDATIVRPGPVYGDEDRFLNNMALRRLWLQTNGGRQWVRPTHVTDLAAALDLMVFDDSTVGKTYELYGPERLQMAEIYDMVKGQVKKQMWAVDLPKPVLNAVATFFQYAVYWQGPITPDQVERMFIDQVETRGALGFADLGITPRVLTEQLAGLVHFHRPNTFLHDTPETDERRRREKEAFADQ